MNVQDCLFRLRELRGKISGGDEKFDEERIAAMRFAENAIVSIPINCENIYFDEYGIAHDRKLEKPLANADRIRSMTDEELAKFLTKHITARCRACDWYAHCVLYGWATTEIGWLDWLKQEEEDE